MTGKQRLTMTGKHGFDHDDQLLAHAASVTPQPFTPHPTPYTPHPTPYTLQPTPFTLHLTPYTLHPTGKHAFSIQGFGFGVSV